MRKLSKFLSLLLRHRPSRFPVVLDEMGYADLSEVMRILHGLPNFRWATLADVEEIVSSPGRRRFEIVSVSSESAYPSEMRIRALYGHTAIRPTYEAVIPPDVLYHGTAPENLPSIRQYGLMPMARHYVHLATDTETAYSIAIRHTRTPSILAVNAAAAHSAGIEFYNPNATIYLVEKVPPAYIRFDEVTGRNAEEVS